MGVDYRQAARAAAARYGYNPELFVAQLQQESGFNPNAVSPAGARGIAQIMPATARGWGVDPMNPLAAIDAAARNMAGYLRSYKGDYRKALAAYNAGPGAVSKYGGVPPYRETQDYVKRIMGAAAGGQTGATAGFQQSVAAPTGYQSTSGTTTNLPAVPSAPTARFNPRLTRTLAAATAGASMVFPTQVSSGPSYQPVAAMAAPNYAQAASNAVGRLVGQPLDRPGARTSSRILDFARKAAGILGQPVQLGTGTRHNRMTTSGNVSAHWSGNALDLPATGSRLVAIGQAALIAAGADPAWARKQKAGLYNIGGYQVIFGTNSRALGGNHTDHVHVGVRG